MNPRIATRVRLACSYAILKFSYKYGCPIQGDMAFVLNFSARPLGATQKPNELRMGLRVETFGDIEP